MYTQGSYLRVMTPRTTNGNNVVVNERGVVEYKEAHLPLTAKRSLELLNRNTPQHLRKKIEVVKGNVQEQKEQPNQELIEAQKKIELLQKQLAQMQQGQVNQPQKQNQDTAKPTKV